MPEGDTIHRAASSLRPALEGKRIVSARGWSRFLDADILNGKTVDRVEARGKHLLFHLDCSAAIHSHMGMTGSWHVYANNQKWTKSERQAALVIKTEAAHAIVCFTPKVLEILSAIELRRHAWLGRLAPDLLDPNFDESSVEKIIERFRVHQVTPIGEAIMNQSVICGIGNVYKSEVLFLLGLNPFAAVCEFDNECLKSLITTSQTLLQRNFDGRSRQTVFGVNGAPGQNWVYGRSGQRCRKCEASILMRRQGDLGRSTYYCPRCQSI